MRIAHNGRRKAAVHFEGIMDKQQIIEAIKDYAEQYGLPAHIVYGVCMRESVLDPFAARYEPHYKWLYKPSTVKPSICSLDTETILQKTSIGLMQVMGGVYRELGYRGWLSALFANPELQLEYGCRHLAAKIRKYGLEGGISAYNAGAPDRDRDGKIDNPEYVKAVMTFAAGFKR